MKMFKFPILLVVLIVFLFVNQDVSEITFKPNPEKFLFNTSAITISEHEYLPLRPTPALEKGKTSEAHALLFLLFLLKKRRSKRPMIRPVVKSAVMGFLLQRKFNSNYL
ncbi:hypothetical protein [Halobacillus sp. BBL2006]|uniref:hypothetical protein n=1 Tax=Halobacillus sp. BBL2006 TaxID=1543706 RepID=UPI000542B941|nr:hypothetical protein [Halobacillus sp. BBL2006]KHE72199.1 hypothetical protein LD39_05810 [Halobacillus sp. BBL2006]